MPKVSAIELKKGSVVEHNGGIWRVTSTEHVKPGKGGAFIQAEMKNIKTGTKLNERFRSEDKVEKLIFESVPAQFLYNSGTRYSFMRDDNLDEVEIDEEIIGENVVFLIDQAKVKIEFADDQVVGVEFPDNTILTVVETEPYMKNATATAVTKPAKLNNGLLIQVPGFITEGEKILVRIEDKSYLERA